jgi:hypothetical protein
VKERLSAAHIAGDVKERFPISAADVLGDQPLAIITTAVLDRDY